MRQRERERERERNREGSIGFIVVTSDRFTLKSWNLLSPKTPSNWLCGLYWPKNFA